MNTDEELLSELETIAEDSPRMLYKRTGTMKEMCRNMENRTRGSQTYLYTFQKKIKKKTENLKGREI